MDYWQANKDFIEWGPGRIKPGDILAKQEIIKLLSLEGEETQALYQYADEIRESFMGNSVHLRGIIEFSNYCRQNCHYCGLRLGNKNLKRYRLSFEEILEVAAGAVQLGYKTLVLQAGEDTEFSKEAIASLVQQIKQFDVAVTLSLGEQDYASYKLWRNAGADRYLLKHETADPALYGILRPGKTLEERLSHQFWLKELGYQLGSGCIVGLPGQTLQTLAEDLLLLKKMDVDMAGIGPFIPHPETPLAGYERGGLDLTLKTLAVARIMMPCVHLPATTALGSVHSQGRELALQAGANVIMPNVSPTRYRSLYQIYPNKICLDDDPGKCSQCIRGKIMALGRTAATDQGHSLKIVGSSQ